MNQMETNQTSAPQPSEAVYEMLWDCDFCQTRRLLGLTHRFCPNCGAPQNPIRRYFPPDDQKIAVQNHPFVGADKLCPSCHSPSSANVQFCGQCGAPLDKAKSVPTQPDQVDGLGQKPGHEAHTLMDSKPDAKSSYRLPLIAGGLLVLGILLTAIFWTQSLTLTLTQSQWERSIQIDAFQPRSEGNWCEYVPFDAHSVMQVQQVRYHRQIPDGQVCHHRRVDRGDGTFVERQECSPKYRNEPVYDTYCHYSVNRWGYARSIVTTGNDHNPYWGEIRLNGTGGQCLGCERESGRTEKLFFNLKTKEGKFKEYRCDVPGSLWYKAEPGSVWQVEQGRMLGEPRCDTLKPLD